MRNRLPCALGLVLATGLASQSPQYTNLGTWVPSWPGGYWVSGCWGSMPPAQFAVASPPVPGGALLLGINNLPDDAAFMLTGLSNSTSSFGPLPLYLGWGQCIGFVRPDDTSFLVGSGSRATYALAIPANGGLVGLHFYQQALVLDANAPNPAGIVMSDAFDARIGTVGSFPLPVLVQIAPGSFPMGSNHWLSGSTTQPVHTVHITRSFWIGRFEVTQAEYQAVVGINPSHFQGPSWPSSASRPVETVSWYDAMSYCAALTAQEVAAGRLPAGYQYRLPTEAEWEYCCRAGTTTEWNTGTTLNCGQANFWNSTTGSLCVGQTSVVGSYPANNWGLHDMHGNEWEWCLDAWDGSTGYSAGPVSDPFVYGGPYRVIRGGRWSSHPDGCRSAFRYGDYPSGGYSVPGFRVVLAPVLVP